MKNAMLLLAATMALAVSATAAPKKVAAAKPIPAQMECPVMKGVKTDTAKATKNKKFVDYKGNRYFMCCDSCAPAFNKEPEKYAKGPHIAIPKK